MNLKMKIENDEKSKERKKKLTKKKKEPKEKTENNWMGKLGKDKKNTHETF